MASSKKIAKPKDGVIPVIVTGVMFERSKGDTFQQLYVESWTNASVRVKNNRRHGL